MSTEFDVVVIGAGPGGYVAAIRASQLGLKTAIIERENLGGICLNWGCIPTKALLKSGEIYEQLSHLSGYGLAVEKASFDFNKIIERSRGVAKQMSGGIAFLMKKHKIEVIEGEAKLEKGAPAPKVVVALKAGGSRTVQAKNVILASGARAREIPAIGAVSDGDKIWTYRDALATEDHAQVAGRDRLGRHRHRVTVVEAIDRIMPVEDEEVSKAAQKAFEKRGIKFRVSKIEKTKDGVAVTVEAGGKIEQLTAEKCIVAVGIAPNNDGLEALGVNLDRGHVATDKHGKTNVPGLYAIGDIAGAPWLAHKASHEGIHAAEAIAGYKTPNVHSPIPGCTYANPQVASAAGIEVKAGRFPFRVNGKAVAAGEIEGFVKTVFDAKTGALIGAHMIGHEVTEMIQGFVTAITLEATEEDLHGIVYAHPTMSEAMHEAALDAYGRVLHI
ncbi:Dihydrolipoyl dehydrogenase [Aphelenchoides fujianensis]|nr:Dihydrolipoyl dehydrogenase [Aphelenchoides fujianensis]